MDARYCFAGRFLTFLMFLAACGAGNGNGHDRLKSVHSQANSDGPWHCHTATGPKLREIDGKNNCYRSSVHCDEMRQIAQQLGLEPSTCQQHKRAVCFSGFWENRTQPLESCFITGDECERVFKISKRMNPNVEFRPCAEQDNEHPP